MAPEISLEKRSPRPATKTPNLIPPRLCYSCSVSSAFISLFLSLLLFASSNVKKTSFVTNFFQTIFYPILSPIATGHQKFDGAIKYLKDIPSIYDQNRSLRTENQSLKLAIKKFTDEQQVLGVISSFSRTIPLRLVGESDQLLFTSKDLSEIKIGQPVVVDQQLIGLVKEVNSRLIKVSPTNDPDIKLSIQLDSGLRGTYAVEKDVAVVTSLPNDATYSPNTLVLTLPTDLIPENLIIGEIDQVISASSDPFQKLKVKISKPTNHNYFLILQP